MAGFERTFKRTFQRTFQRTFSLSLLPVVRAGVLAAAGILASCSATNPNPRADDPLPQVNVDLPRYMGKWYNIAHIPYFGESGYVGSYSEWTLRPDGQIDDIYAGHKGNFAAPETRKSFIDTVVPGTHNADWRVHLWGPIAVHQVTIYVDPDYQVTLLGYPGKSLGWVFARTPDLTDQQYQALLSRLDAMGYDISRFKRVPQHPDQIGRPGFLGPDE